MEAEGETVRSARLADWLGGSRPTGPVAVGRMALNRAEVELSSLEEGAVAVVSRISEVAEREAPALLGYLLERRLVPSARIEVLEVDQVGRTVRIRVAKREVVLSHETGGKVWVI